MVLFLTNDEPFAVTITADNSVRFSYAGYAEWRQVQLAALAVSAESFIINPGNTGFPTPASTPSPNPPPTPLSLSVHLS